MKLYTTIHPHDLWQPDDDHTCTPNEEQIELNLGIKKDLAASKTNFYFLLYLFLSPWIRQQMSSHHQDLISRKA